MRLSFIAAAALWISSLAAHADTFTFNSGSTSLVFTLPNSPMPFNSAQGDGFAIAGVTAAMGATSEVISVAFYDQNGTYQNGGFGYEDSSGQHFFNGPQVYTGLDSSPTFVDSDYTLQGATLNITSSSVTPEPSSIALLGTGVLGIAGVVRKRFA